MRKCIAALLLFFGFWGLGYLAQDRQTYLTPNRSTAAVSTAGIAGMLTAGFWLLCSKKKP